MNCLALTLSAILLVSSPPSEEAADRAADAICSASAETGVHPAWLVAYLGVENPEFRVRGEGSDVGLFQINQAWHPMNDPLSYEAQAMKAASIIAANIESFGMSWRAVAAYNSWRQAQKETPHAVSYFQRWRAVIEQVAPLWAQQQNIAMREIGEVGRDG